MPTTPNFTDGTWVLRSTAQFAGDPNGDILWQNIADQSLVLWEQDGATTTAVSELPSLDGYDVVAVGDFDGDGLGDPFLRSGNFNKILLSSTGSITNTNGSTYDVRAATDLDGDGTSDIITKDPGSGLIAGRLLDGTSQVSQTVFASGYDAGDMLHSAFNGEAAHTFDSLWFDTSASNYNIASFDAGVRTVTDAFTVTSGRAFDSTSDFNGDGGEDFLFIDRLGAGQGDAEVVFSNGASETGRINWDASDWQNRQIVAGGDFDNDGNAELMLRDGVSGETQLVNAVGGNDASTTIYGSDGDDLIDGRGGNDRIFGLEGDDFLLGGANNDSVDGGGGNDSIEGGDGDDFLYGRTGNDILEGEAGNDVLEGGDGDDLISTGPDMDIADGGEGDDHIFGSSSSGSFDIIRGGAGNDVLTGVGGRTLMEGGSGDDFLSGGSSLDWMYGDAGDDIMIGGLSLDRLYGGSGNDVLIGVDIGGTSGQSDTMTGGSGRDIFVLGNEDTSYYAGSGRAVIRDFFYSEGSSASDHIMLNGLSAAYDFVQDGADVEIRFDGTTNLVADVLGTTVAEVTAGVIYMG